MALHKYKPYIVSIRSLWASQAGIIFLNVKKNVFLLNYGVEHG